MPDHIDPAAIPGDNLRPDMVEIAAGEISTIGDDVSDQGGVVVSTLPAESTTFSARVPAASWAE